MNENEYIIEEGNCECGGCELFDTLDCPYIGAVNELTHFEFLPCYAYIEYKG